MSKLDHLPRPSKCFCQLDLDLLKKWSTQRYVQNRSTIELLSEAGDKKDREAISVVALLDVDDEQLLEMMGDVNRSDHHILHCRKMMKKMLAGHRFIDRLLFMIAKSLRKIMPRG
jgi:hypothetical protein